MLLDFEIAESQDGWFSFHDWFRQSRPKQTSQTVPLCVQRLAAYRTDRNARCQRCSHGAFLTFPLTRGATRSSAEDSGRYSRLSSKGERSLRRCIGDLADSFSIKGFITLRRNVPRKIAGHRAFHQLRPKTPVAEN